MQRLNCGDPGKMVVMGILLALLVSCGGGRDRDPMLTVAGSASGTGAQEGRSKPADITGQTLDTHAVSIDAEGKLLSWVTPPDKAFDRVSFLSWDLLLNRIPVDPSNGLKVYFTHSEYDPDNFGGSGWPNNPAGKNAMLAESAALYYAYSGNRGVIDLVSSLLNHQLQYGTTPAAYVWGNVPWSTAQAGSVTYGNDASREGAGVLEPDKVGELGFHGYLRFWQITGDSRYRDAAIACADALVMNIRTGNSTQSPWPYRVRAQDGQVVEDYTAHVIAPIRLFDELIRLNLGNVAGYSTARQAAWNWLMTYPMVNGRWSQYFEDVPKSTDQFSNLNQYAPGQTARYLLDNPDKDPSWQSKVAGLINFIETNFGGDQYGDLGLYLGARVISEQYAYMYKMASHTSRFGAVNALYASATGDAAAKDKAFRSLNWATYMARDNGGVAEGPAEFVANRPFWFTDGHGDYVRHFMIAMGAFPEWAPSTENHLLRSSSVVRSVIYANAAIDYQTYDSASTEVFRVGSAPVSVTANGIALPLRNDLAAAGWTFESATGVLTVRHDAATQIRVAFDGAQAPPMIGAFSPADGASAVAASSMVTVTFNQSMDASTINDSTFVLRSAAGAAIAATVSYNATMLTATLTPSAALAGSTTYTATLTGGASGILDLAGNTLGVTRTWSFTTAAVDTTPPTVTTSAPASGATAVATNSTVTTSFSEAMNTSTINGSTFVLRNAAGAAITATVSYNATTLTATLTPSAALAGSTTYTATLTGGASGVKDLAGNALAVNRTWSFTTASAGSAPTSIWPASAVPAVASDSDTRAVNLGLKFRSDQGGFITGIRFYKGSGNAGTHIGTLWSSGGTQLATATFTGETASGWQQVSFATPVAIAANTVYVVSYLAPNGRYAADNNYFAAKGFDNAPLHALQTGISGGNGVYAYGSGPTFPTLTYQSSNYWVDVVFTTAAVDTTPPTVTASAPASGATAVATNSTVTTTFSEAMNTSTINGSTFVLRNAAGATIVATVSYNATTLTATLTPSAALAGSTTYTVTLTGGASGVKDLAGNALAVNRTWSFTTAAVDTTPPTVTASAPASGATAVATNSTVTTTFSEAMNASTINGSTFVLRNAAGATIAATVSYNATTLTATLTPSAALAGSTTYTVTLTGGASGVKDLAGNALAVNRTWSFTTAAVDTTPPTVTASAPASGATAVATNSTVTTSFSEAMNASTINGSTFVLRNAAGATIAATVSYNATTLTATLTPSAALAGSTTYTVTLTGGASGVKDLAGNALAVNRTWSFTTAAVDTTPPTVTASAPASGATAVATNSTVTTSFSEAMNASTINGSTFVLRNAAGATIAATVSYNATTLTATLTPSAALAGSTTYTVTLTGGASGVKDLAGNALAVNRTWSFTTMPALQLLVVMGSNSEGTSTDYITDAGSAYINANRVQVQVAGSITTFKAKLGAIAGRYQLAIFADQNGVPGALLAQTGDVGATATGWQTYRLTAPLPVLTGQWYWIAIWSNDVNARVYTSSGSLRWGAYPYSSSWPSVPLLAGSAPFAYSIYATID